MNKLYRRFPKLTLLGLFLIVLILFERGYDLANESFRIDKIRSINAYYSVEDISHNEKDIQEASKALTQKFYYLARGSQSYAFESEDGRYILKFFRNHRWRLSPIMRVLPLPSYLDKKRKHWIKKKKNTVREMLKSCQVAYTLFQENTGVIYTHLETNQESEQEIIIQDPLKMDYTLKCDEFEFVLQKKAVMTDHYLLDLKEKGETAKAKKAIRKLLNFTLYRHQKGYSDKDPHLIKNFGFINNKPVEIDIGGFIQDPKKDDNYFFSHELLKIQNKMLPWLNSHYPELSPFLKQQINTMIKTRNFLPIYE